MNKRYFYRVVSDIHAIDRIVRDHLFHGYEDRQDFSEALRRLIHRWGGRTGESISERNGFRLLRFHDTPGGRPDEEWIPGYLTEVTDMPDYLQEPTEYDRIIAELDEAFGFST